MHVMIQPDIKWLEQGQKCPNFVCDQKISKIVAKNIQTLWEKKISKNCDQKFPNIVTKLLQILVPSDIQKTIIKVAFADQLVGVVSTTSIMMVSTNQIGWIIQKP